MKIVTEPQNLHQPCREVKRRDAIKKLVTEMKVLLDEHQALGLAANQVGRNLRLFVMKQSPEAPDRSPTICVVNPEIHKTQGTQFSVEACLSVPGVKYRMKRAKVLVVKGFNEDWKPVRYRFHGLGAATVCHEIDHLDGKLIIDNPAGGGRW